jgi:sigma-B regulation protein RsbU (phosphoserine phosphatase)
MQRDHIYASLDTFIRLQTLCGAVIVASWAIFWAVGQPITSVRDLFIYVLIQVNLTVLMLKPLKLLYENRRFSYHWPLHAAALVVASSFVVVISAAVIYRVNGWQSGFENFLLKSWKFPFVANLVYSFAFEAYNVTACRLRYRNRQLQTAIDSEIAGRELDAAEMQQAREIQQGLLPKEIPQLPEFEITGIWEPAKLVGGDYYDVIQLSKDKLAICIADVVGKGISAALLMANIQASVRAFASDAVSPAYVCSRINSVLCANIAPGKFVTLFYGVLDARDRTLQFTNAGHLRPILIDDHGRVRHLENEGALLGVFPNWKYDDSTVELRPGDLLMLFTDGITEAMSPNGVEFGEENLIDAAIGLPEQTLDELQSQILEQVKHFCNSRMSDDATLILLAAPRVGAEERNIALHQRRASEQIIYAGVNS